MRPSTAQVSLLPAALFEQPARPAPPQLIQEVSMQGISSAPTL